jgi:hypothetical protein
MYCKTGLMCRASSTASSAMPPVSCQRDLFKEEETYLRKKRPTVIVWQKDLKSRAVLTTNSKGMLFTS